MIRRVTLVVIGCLAAVLLAGTEAAGAVDLQYKFKPGEVVRHKIVVDMDVALAISAPNAPQIPPMHIKVVGFVKQKTNRVLPDGNAEVTDTVESMTMMIGGETRKLPLEKVPPITGMVSRFGPANPLASAGGNGSALSTMPLGNFGMTQYILLPGQALNIGDYWTDTVNLPLGANIQQRSTLVSEKAALGRYSVAVIKQDLSGDIDVPFSQLAALAGQMPGVQQIPFDGNLKALVVGGMNSYFSAEKGRVIRTDGTMDMQMDADVKDASASGKVAVRAHMNFSVNVMPPK